jgi:hypothetical protein
MRWNRRRHLSRDEKGGGEQIAESFFLGSGKRDSRGRIGAPVVKETVRDFVRNSKSHPPPQRHLAQRRTPGRVYEDFEAPVHLGDQERLVRMRIVEARGARKEST